MRSRSSIEERRKRQTTVVPATRGDEDDKPANVQKQISWSSDTWTDYTLLRSSVPSNSVPSNEERDAISKAIEEIPSSVLMTCTTPLACTLAFCRTNIRLLLLYISILCFVTQNNVWYQTVESPGPAQRLRFRSLQARDGSTTTGVNIENFRVLYNGSPIRAAHTLQTNGTSLVVSFTKFVNFTGWAFDTSLSSPVEKDPTVFYFEIERDGRWLVAGGSGPFYFASIMTYLPMRFGTCRPRGCPNVFLELEPGDFSSCFETCTRWWIGITHLHLCIYCSMQRFIELMHRWTSFFYLIGFLVLFSGGITRHWTLEYSPGMDLQEQMSLFVDSIRLSLHSNMLPMLLLTVTQYAQYRYYVWNYEKTGLIGISSAALWQGVWLTGTGILLHVYGKGYSEHKSGATAAYELGLPCLVMFLVVKSWYAYSRLAAKRCVYKGQKIYDILWSIVSIRAESDLRRLDLLLKEIEGKIAAIAHLNPPRQCWTQEQRERYWQPKPVLTGDPGAQSSKNQVVWEGPLLGTRQSDGSETVTSFGYLLKESQLVDMRLRDKTLAWALQSGGLFFCKDQSDVLTDAAGAAAPPRPPGAAAAAAPPPPPAGAAGEKVEREREGEEGKGGGGSARARVRESERAREGGVKQSAESGRGGRERESERAREGGVKQQQLAWDSRNAHTEPHRGVGGLESVNSFTIEERCIRWASLKGAKRAVEKTIRVYDGDVSRLTDLCRQAIIFESVADIVACVQAIQRDSQVTIVRVKNRLRHDYDTNATAGYRDVNLNIRILDAEADVHHLQHLDHFATPATPAANCCDAADKKRNERAEEQHGRKPLAAYHICEVQLILREFAAIRSEGGHKAYIKYRNMIGE